MLFTAASLSEDISLPDANLKLHHYFLDEEEGWNYFHLLANQTPWRQDEIAIAGKTIPVPRLQAWYGDSSSNYGYSGIALSPLPWTELLASLKERIEAFTGHAFNSVLANYYRNGDDSVSWHADDEPELGTEPVIASLSLGASRSFRLKSRCKPVSTWVCPLDHGSLLVMGAGTQRHYLHQIPKEKSVCHPRINLTFRYIHTS